MVVEFGLLGGVRAHRDGTPVDLGHRRQRGVLGVLLAEADRLVPVERLLDRVWGEPAPRRGRDTLYSYLARLRGVLAGLDGVRLERHSGGYRLALEERAVDLHRFHYLLTEVRATRDDGQAMALYEQALALYRGEPLPELDSPWAAELRAALERHRLAAELDHADTALRLGRHADLLPVLTSRTDRHPLDERLAGQLMLALYRNGRPADALSHYQQLRARLADELGTDPGPSLQRLHQQILAVDPDLAEPAEAARTREVPRQLPAVPGHFTGRAAELAELDTSFDAGATVLVSAIGGVGGIGKTWLALAWAHRNLERFPDGQLFVDLHGFSPAGDPVEPAVALRGFLDALAVDPDRIPVDVDARAALYRSLVADKQVLVVLDNAATAEQVVPLLPGSPSCTVLVTGRHRLASLIDRHGARHLSLDVLSHNEARTLLTARLGADRVAAEPDAVEELIELCGGHPLALSITARTAATHPAVPLAEVATELRELGLEMLDHDTDPAASLPTVLSWSLRYLTDQQRTLFALLAIAPGPDTGLPAAASLAGVSQREARSALRTLTDASLIDHTLSGRYAMHDLVRAYAATLAHDLSEHVRAALARVTDFYLHTAHAAAQLLYPQRESIRPDPPVPGTHPQPLPDRPAALAWLESHHPHLLAAQHTAGSHQAVWQLAWTLHTLHRRRGYRREALAVWQAATAAADQLPDPVVRILAHRYLGLAYARLEQHEQADDHLHHALALADHHHDIARQAHVSNGLSVAWALRGDDRKALQHAQHTLDLFRSLDQPVGEAAALTMTGWLAARLGDHDTARDHCRRALELHRHHHNVEGEASTLDSLGWIAHHTGNHHQAIDHYHQALALFRAIDHNSEVANTLDHLGHPHAVLGQPDHAREVWREALRLYREQGRDDDADRVRRQLDDIDPVKTP
ncbi:AfsR/SARP family transcriptional regulator [Saccharothrix obliqua]|uniref:AfsR/SARP family transcriptional regulator n=1 Tax=Saccharothrix obliqua TaxID=2861747 RepID=UPI001C5EE98B|nr:BTAD domain-containing putative transcriptional regulator [Saccharothrix obliqua]MBW4721339.1 tetratricopeptide repeat protein [Saccharothrix obliqua]